MAGQAVRELGDEVRGGRRDHQQVRAIGELDVTGPPILLFIVETRHDRILGERLQSEWRDELGRVLRHDDKKFVALFDEQAGELGRFVSGDRPGDAEHDRFRARPNPHNVARARFSVSAFEALFHARSTIYSRIALGEAVSFPFIGWDANTLPLQLHFGVTFG
jgi:hypothetical protein